MKKNGINKLGRALICASLILGFQSSAFNSLSAQNPVVPDSVTAGQKRVDEVM